MQYNDMPAVLLLLTIWCYWFGVGAMIVRARRKTHDLAGLVPEQSFERAMFVIWIPLVIAWIVLPWLALTRANPLFAVPQFVKEEPLYAALRWLAALIALACLAMTASEKRKGTLITDGLFAYVRHPIYSLSMLLMLCTAIIIATPLMLGIWAVHLVLNNLKARNEERHLLATHGEPYAQYLRRTGRFFPRFAAQTS
ncbi:MAG: isoprenylcysteine carboxylmethyltransferase family protein [Betaproteobacteria bacterium]|nr:MAG: isoprenylcysteine carboxylmethyltransferase family protein [Betaproteobacteria bacterium]